MDCFRKNGLLRWQTAELGPWNVDLRRISLHLPGRHLFVRFKNQGIPNYATLSMEMTTAGDKLISLPLEGYAARSSARAKPDIESAKVTGIQLTAETLTGACKEPS